jgi:hypothetical protein
VVHARREAVEEIRELQARVDATEVQSRLEDVQVGEAGTAKKSAALGRELEAARGASGRI